MLGWLIRFEAALHGQRRGLILGAGVVAGALVAATGAGAGLDRVLRDARDTFRHRPASGQVVVVEIDKHSIDHAGQWPWPRSAHAKAIDRLRAAGAATIAFDVDFSSASTPAEDRALADALRRAGGSVVLATFSQYGSVQDHRTIDSLPAPALRDHAALAAVTVEADSDALIRRMPLGKVTGATPRPSLAAMIAGVKSSVGQDFPIDYSIDLASIPKYSFHALLAGRVPRAAIAGKHVIIGATAIELGDRYGVPRHGIVPGVLIHAVAAETLLEGRTPRHVGPVPALLVALVAIGALGLAGFGQRIAGFAAGSALLLLGPIAAESWFGTSLVLAPALAAMVAALAVAAALHFSHGFARRVLRNIDTELPNLTALELDWSARDACAVAVARISDYARLASGLGHAGAAELVRKLAERLALVTGDSAIYRIEESALAWTVTDASVDALDGRFAAAAALMRMPVQCAGRSVDVTLHFGVADDEGATAPAQLVFDAGLAAAQAEASGHRWTRFVSKGESETRWALSLLGELDQAIERGEVWVAYQPKLELAGNTIAGAEALVRWHHAERGPIAPDDFIPIVEANGRSADLTEFVLRRALADFASLPPELTVSVNIAANLLGNHDLVTMVEDALVGSGVRPGRLTLEITESAAMAESSAAMATLDALKRLGVTLSIDDYGTGQSTLSYLKRLPATELKIDKSFIEPLLQSRSDEILVSSTIAMAHNLGLKVVAEGVEDAAQLERLQALGCDVIQGYLIGKPVPLADFQRLAAMPARAAA